jgi:hypothetical protein
MNFNDIAGIIDKHLSKEIINMGKSRTADKTKSKANEASEADTELEPVIENPDVTQALIPEVLSDDDEGPNIPEVLSDDDEGPNETEITTTGHNDIIKLTKEDINKHVVEINKLVVNDLIKTATKVGNYILEHFFNNDYLEAVSKNPHKPVSYRDLQKHKDLNIPFNMLNQMVRVAAQEKILLDTIFRNIKLLSYSHRVELLQVDESEKKIEFARRSIDGEFTVRKLRNVIKGKVSHERSTEITPFNSILTDILTTYSEEALNSLSFSKIQKMKSYVDVFLNQVDLMKEQITKIQIELEPIFDAKKLEHDLSKIPGHRGRPKKEKETPV